MSAPDVMGRAGIATADIALRDLIGAVTTHVIAHTEELTDLDRAIGDGDHGTNMERGCRAVLADLDKLAILPTHEALRSVGKTLVLTVGGASGPLFGTFFMALGDALGANGTPLSAVAAAFDAAISAVAARGKSKVGEKTMLDVLVPVGAVLRESREDGVEWLRRVREVAQDSALATARIPATKGRASYLGERSIGHVDPGARSVWLMVEAVCLTSEEVA